MVLFPGFQALDVFGPLDALNMLSRDYYMTLVMLAQDARPVSTRPLIRRFNPQNSTFSETVVSTHLYSDIPPLDVLIVPGGPGTRAPDLNSTLDFIAEVYPSLKYLIAICTGVGLVSRAGVLDGKHATTNKAAWDSVTARRPQVLWTRPARWVVDGNTWTSSGVSSGIDVTLAFIAEVYGEVAAQKVADDMEYERRLDSSLDPFVGKARNEPVNLIS